MIKQTNNAFDAFTAGTFNYSSDVNLYYEICGSGRRNILFIHGFAASLETWRHIRDYFTSDYKVILVDLKGFGNSSKPDDYGYSALDQAEIVARFIQFLEMDNIVLVGHSFGGAISILAQSILKETGIIKKLILIDPVTYLQKLNFSAKLLKAPLLKHLIMYFVPDKYKASFTLRFIFNKTKDTIKEKTAKFAEYLKQPGAYKALLKSAELMVPNLYNSVAPALGGINVPVFIIWGEKDKVLPLELGHRLNKDIKNSILEIIPGCGHVPQSEAPEKTIELIKNFLEQKN
jgi:pimeloyl-ACP methyl ester carboxylesterase